MSFTDKVKLLFADWNLRKETHGEQNLITLQEEKAITEDMRKRHEIDQYNQLIDLYNMSNFLMIDIQTAILCLKLSIEKAHGLALAIILHGQSIDQLESLFFTISSSERTSRRDLEETIKTNTWHGLLSLFQPHDEEKALDTREPNHHIQMLFEKLVRSNKVLRKKLYSLEYIVEKAQIDFLNKDHQELIVESKEQLKYVEDLDGFLSILTVYKKHYELGLIQKENFAHPIFLELIVDHKNVLPLTDQEKNEVELEIDQYIADHN